MNGTPSVMAANGVSHTLLDRVATLASWVVAAALFFTVGWHILKPDDPQGAMSLLSRHGPVRALMQAAALAGVVAAVATVLAGRRLPDAGVFAAAIGLAIASLRGGTVTQLLMRPTGSERTLALEFAAEAVGWFVVIAVAAAVGGLVMWWCFGGEPRGRDGTASVSARDLALFDVPGLGSRLKRTRKTTPADGLRFAALAAAGSAVASTVLSAGLTLRTIQHGQACFVVGAGVFVGHYVAHRFFPVRSALWALVSVGLLATLAYLWAAVRPAIPSLPPYIPSCHFLRVLPVQFLGVGVAAALAAHWNSYPADLDSEDR